jgi:hypothetical protein
MPVSYNAMKRSRQLSDFEEEKEEEITVSTI